MKRRSKWGTALPMCLAAAAMAGAGGLAMASNMAFKFNKLFYGSFNAAQSPKRNNWISLPYNHPYTTVQDLCTALGIPNGTIIKVNPRTGSTSNSPSGCTPPVFPLCGGNCSETGFTFNCGTAITAIPDLICITSAGLQIRINGGPSTVAEVVLGSHNETKAFPIIRGNYLASKAPIGDNWVSVPYHTTWSNAQDVCDSVGLNVSGGVVTRVDASPNSGIYIDHVCTATNPFQLVTSDALLVRKLGNTDGNCDADGNVFFNGPNICNFVPSHF